MQIIQKTKGGISYLAALLRQKKRVVTRAIFWKVPHNSGTEEVHLKLGRYTTEGFDEETLQVGDPKSELTLDDTELRNLLKFVSENYEPFRVGVSKYIPLDESFNGKNLAHIRAIFQNPDKEKLLKFILDNKLLPTDLVMNIQHQERVQAIKEFEQLLEEDALEERWQKWFAKNSWVLGSDFVRILDERTVDTSNVVDYLVQAYDGFLDLIEIKRPGGGLRFWAASQDHGNYIPSSDLVKAISQSTQYIYELEREVNSQKFYERVGEVRTVKPRSVLVFGRSSGWDETQRRAYRILNASYHNLSIMTYDHVLARAKRMLGLEDAAPSLIVYPDLSEVNPEDIPF